MVPFIFFQEDASLPSSPILLVPLVHKVAFPLLPLPLLALAAVRNVVVVAERYLVYVGDSLSALPRLHDFQLLTLLALKLFLDEVLALFLYSELHRIFPFTDRVFI